MEKVMQINEIYLSIIKASQNIKPYVYHTPLEYSLSFSKETKANVYLKLESDQKSGSFKVRGAFNKLLSDDNCTDKEYVTASTGNHGMACALALTTLNKKGIVYTPTNVSKAKESNVKLYGIELQKFGTDCVETETEARKQALANEKTYISPYADMQVIFGQGTIAKELLDDLPKIDAVFVTVGGGGLISGIGAFFKACNLETQIVGCLPENSPVMMESIKAGHIIEMESLETLSDASAGGLEQGTPTFALCQQVVDRWIKVSEDEIANAMFLMLERHHKVVEGSAGCALASFLRHSDEYIGKNVVILVCGSNVSLETLKFIINRSK